MKTAALVLWLALVGLAFYAAEPDAAEADDKGDDDSADPLGLDWIADMIATENAANRAAFLAMLRRSETGTAGPGAYWFNVGDIGRGSLTDLSQHPRRYVARFNSTAAGAYQINAPTWDTEIQPALRLPDFSPASQDRAALWLLEKSGALGAIDRGDFARAVRLAAPRWASLAGAGYGQRENSLTTLQAWYSAEGGRTA